MQKHPAKIDVPVLLIFFARPETFEKVFESVRQARPSTLLLWQDGPREGREDDVIGVQRCREIAENIDWECTVYKKYNEKNFGCDPSTFYSHKWAFSLVDKCIILEDDRIPAQSFYPYCKYLLDKYKMMIELITFAEQICLVIMKLVLMIISSHPADQLRGQPGNV